MKENFEEKLNRIEEIVDILDKGKEPLDQLIQIYDEGMKLSSECREYLDSAEQKIIDISKKYNLPE
ncbi:MAG: exodeoxyribonuclease VII small subunit [bacterium]